MVKKDTGMSTWAAAKITSTLHEPRGKIKIGAIWCRERGKNWKHREARMNKQYLRKNNGTRKFDKAER